MTAVVLVLGKALEAAGSFSVARFEGYGRCHLRLFESIPAKTSAIQRAQRWDRKAKLPDHLQRREDAAQQVHCQTTAEVMPEPFDDLAFRAEANGLKIARPIALWTETPHKALPGVDIR